jgi:hypothetical protein
VPNFHPFLSEIDPAVEPRITNINGPTSARILIGVGFEAKPNAFCTDFSIGEKLNQRKFWTARTRPKTARATHL